MMGLDNMQRGFLHILESLFSPQAMYGRAERLIGRLDAHIFTSSHPDRGHLSAALRSFARQSLSGVWTQEQRSYLHLLKRAVQLDKQFLRDIPRKLGIWLLLGQGRSRGQELY